MKITVKYHWQLPVVMSRAGYRSSTDLIEPLADRGIMLSRSQVYRLTRTPERMSLNLLAALCDIFDIGMNELITVESERIRSINKRIVNDDGLELDFAVNVVAPYELTQRLRPALAAGSPSRVLVVTGGKASGPFDSSDLQSERSFVPLVNYTMTKRAAEAMSLAIADELAADGIFLTIVYPGRASTAMTQAMTPSSLPWFMRPAWPVFRILIPKSDGGKSAEKAARSSVFAATTDTLEGKGGLYVDTNQQIADLHPTVHDATNQSRVMAVLR